MTVVDMGIAFDGRCAYCHDWISTQGDPIYNRGVVGHGVTHALCSIYGPSLSLEKDIEEE